ncbi:hypothetical protein GCM10009779_16870 [Polymorphospora rubra]|uniref:Uncharacterized protein n=1 Tax=Polymorphospora rubra TaxID=338584 RepID=A0A810N8D9_9ACTN|nr:hypothetical protein Prubr_50790 [Polymorphospora rubra]
MPCCWAGTPPALRSRLSRRFPWAEVSDPDPPLCKVVLRAVRRAELPADSRQRLLDEQVRTTAFQERIRQESRAGVNCGRVRSTDGRVQAGAAAAVAAQQVGVDHPDRLPTCPTRCRGRRS